MSEKKVVQRDKRLGYVDSVPIIAIKVLLAVAVTIGGLLFFISLIDKTMANRGTLALYILGACFASYFLVSIASDIHKVAYYTWIIADAATKQPENKEPEA